MPIKLANSLTYSDSLFPSFSGLESKHSSGSPPSGQSFLDNCRFIANSKRTNHWSSRSPSPLNISQSTHTSPSSNKSAIVPNNQRLAPSRKFTPNNRPSQSPRTSSPPNANRFSSSTSPRNAFNTLKQIRSPTYEAGSDEPIHHSLNLYQMRRRNGGGMFYEDYRADMVFYQEAKQHDSKVRDNAMIELNAKWNSSLDANVVDLHHLFPSQVGRVLDAKVQEIKSRNWKRLYVVTGAGNHSMDRVPKLRPAAEKYAEKNCFRYNVMDGNSGAIVISIGK